MLTLTLPSRSDRGSLPESACGMRSRLDSLTIVKGEELAFWMRRTPGVVVFWASFGHDLVLVPGSTCPTNEKATIKGEPQTEPEEKLRARLAENALSRVACPMGIHKLLLTNDANMRASDKCAKQARLLLHFGIRIDHNLVGCKKSASLFDLCQMGWPAHSRPELRPLF